MSRVNLLEKFPFERRSNSRLSDFCCFRSVLGLLDAWLCLEKIIHTKR